MPASYWSTSPLPRFPRLEENLKVDVVVLGGGITGITTAYLLNKAGAKVALLERDRFGMGDTGRTTAHLTYVTDTRLHHLVQTLGFDHAQAFWDAGLAGFTRIGEIVRAENIDCNYELVPGFLHTPPGGKQEGVETLRKDASVAAEMGFDVEYLDQVPLFGRPGIRFANQGRFHPRKYLVGLLSHLSKNGCHLCEYSEASDIDSEAGKVKANGSTITCKYIVIATHVPLQGATGTVSAALFQTKLYPYSSYVVGAKVPRGSIPDALFWDTAEPYNYLRLDGRRNFDYVILGGADHKTGQGPKNNFGEMERKLRKLFPGTEPANRWSGQVIETNDGLPYMGETAPNQFVATGFSGNGMTFGTVAAMMACDLFEGRANPWQKLFDIHRKKLIGGTWNYLTENKDYPYYMAKQWLSKADVQSPDAIKNGEGKIIQLEGKKVAAYRDQNGKLSLKSAVCTHMGCIVRWNAAESTWDCPCHGSRFKAKGEVLAGPAETALPELK